MKKSLILAALLLSSFAANAQKKVSATSPDGQTKVTVTVSDRIYYDVESHGEMLFQQCHIGMTLRDHTLGEKPVLKPPVCCSTSLAGAASCHVPSSLITSMSPFRAVTKR